MTRFEKQREAILRRYSYICGWKPSDSLLNFYLNGLRYELSPEAEADRNYKKMIWEESKKIYLVDLV